MDEQPFANVGIEKDIILSACYMMNRRDSANESVVHEPTIERGLDDYFAPKCGLVQQKGIIKELEPPLMY